MPRLLSIIQEIFSGVLLSKLFAAESTSYLQGEPQRFANV